MDAGLGLGTTLVLGVMAIFGENRACKLIAYPVDPPFNVASVKDERESIDRYPYARRRGAAALAA